LDLEIIGWKKITKVNETGDYTVNVTNLNNGTFKFDFTAFKTG